jgi:hypothetical protein
MGGVRGRLRRLELATAQDVITFELEDGTTARFAENDVWPSCFSHEYERGRRQFEGEDPGPAHPFVEALRQAAPGEVERLVPEQGTIITLWLGEDEIIRGERERRGGPPATEPAPGPP